MDQEDTIQKSSMIGQPLVRNVRTGRNKKSQPEIGAYLYNVGFFMPEVIPQEAHF